MNCCEPERTENEYYAPVIIPTLCRFDHFKQCIESLARCTWADKTDVYVGLDYPAKESHWEGYKKIKSYLENASFGFKSFNVFVREKNYGFGPNGNIRNLLKTIMERYESFIFSEDDNIFSPNFLVFINKGLQKFKNDKSVLAISGYRHFYPIKKNTNTFFRQNVDFSAWGFGTWSDTFRNFPPCDYFEKKFSLKNLFNVKRDLGANRALNFLSFYFNPIQDWFDVPRGIYAYLENMDVVMPVEKSLVRNIGWDGSGEHCAGKNDLAQMHLTQQISDDTDFEFKGTGFEFYKENRAVFRNCSYAKISEWRFWEKFCKYLVKYLLKKLLRKKV